MTRSPAVSLQIEPEFVGVGGALGQFVSDADGAYHHLQQIAAAGFQHR